VFNLGTRLFDTVRRKPMISATYLGSAAVVVVLGIAFFWGRDEDDARRAAQARRAGAHPRDLVRRHRAA